MPGALDGVLVVSLEQAVAAPFCTSRLADAGARVIKIERESGDLARKYDEVAHGESAYFVWLNRGKQSLMLDIKQPEDSALLKRMLKRADVFVQNLAPGAAERAGFGAEALRAENPRLIVCDITGYGESGPYAEMKAYDFLIQCETGLASITGGPDSPGRVGVSVADIGCGMNAHAAILQALYARERTGEGCQISVSLFDSIADWMAVPLIHREYSGHEPKRIGLNHATIAPYGAYAAGDGTPVHHRDSDGGRMGEPLPRGAGPARHDRRSALLDQRPQDRQPGGARRGDGRRRCRASTQLRWPRRSGPPTSLSAATIRSANLRVTSSCGARRSERRAAPSACRRRRRFSTIIRSRSGLLPQSANTAKRSGANSRARIEDDE